MTLSLINRAIVGTPLHPSEPTHFTYTKRKSCEIFSMVSRTVTIPVTAIVIDSFLDTWYTFYTSRGLSSRYFTAYEGGGHI